ncbi:hydroxycinnamoyl-CoA:5-hydroxyanthranilate N-hydroxycinnamoyltransferase HHT4-like [Lolium rigidum]|uniref:hydroxycinnamoyl-CoA:5-hydroxyanthranilate N-hydroxycinnamoyltransferase HHT4-like n=1 Tax=Lolium rigidum TaxID=89674 RepID=UPI001F5DC82B|nr:hydroxycinnamoyl-CoA:5-hydroxyanthranilate N-hydroxycinnamoyltransferase HHT4-like [Lolium rigidum]
MAGRGAPVVVVGGPWGAGGCGSRAVGRWLVGGGAFLRELRPGAAGGVQGRQAPTREQRRAVEVVEETLVPPSEPTRRHALWLSNLDLAVPKTHTPLVYYYPAPPPSIGGDEDGDDGEEPFFAPKRLREALAKALVPFYPLAGRMAVGPGGRLEIDCRSGQTRSAVSIFSIS